MLCRQGSIRDGVYSILLGNIQANEVHPTNKLISSVCLEGIYLLL